VSGISGPGSFIVLNAVHVFPERSQDEISGNRIITYS